MYYLQSRYYDPVTGRFINTDGLVSTGTGIIGHNMLAYCNNNPVVMFDPNGNCYCAYDGSVCDFKRLERGLPSRNCKCNVGNAISKTKINKSKKDVNINGDTTIKVNSIAIALDIKTYKTLNEIEVIVYRRDLANRILCYSSHTIKMNDEQIYDMMQEFELHRFGSFFGIKSCDVIDVDVLWDYNTGQVYDGRFLVDYGREVFQP